ncbi:DUF6676 family protein [Corynebacterium halotolerans]|uniref:1-deoxy-D-xylulose-5-phosphate synthase n=1 Tax=Corynebacterium halotolerans YIM 70093 = DSM 44683 TaxID=1121362 RepID=M1MXP8_9CORY|nr:DUF6676 family protein [Corynebacterium halotolerans]AGF72504.1 hypothetical protein A605_07510 [Corynebacterium halotolerans YIM 70093 = DSM 44683]
MIPADIDIDDLTRQLEEDSVAVGENHGGLEPALLDAVAYAEANDFGPLGVVVLDRTPPQTADLRDVAQDLQLATDLGTVLVRTPSSGAVVSEVHTRAELESAQHPFLGNPDIPAATHQFIDQVNAAGINWTLVTVLVLVVVVAVAAATACSALTARPHRAGSSAASSLEA